MQTCLHSRLIPFLVLLRPDLLPSANQKASGFRLKIKLTYSLVCQCKRCCFGFCVCLFLTRLLPVLTILLFNCALVFVTDFTKLPGQVPGPQPPGLLRFPLLLLQRLRATRSPLRCHDNVTRCRFQPDSAEFSSE